MQNKKINCLQSWKNLMWFKLWFLIIRGEVTMILPPIGSYICDLRLTCCRKIIIVDGGGVAPYTYIVYIFIL